MTRSPKSLFFAIFLLVLTFGRISAGAADSDEVDFNRDIRPILSDKCFHCHGPDAENQKSDFRIDTREHALKDLDGVRGIVPGDLKGSEVHWRIRLPNDDIDVMPPLKSNRVLSNREKDLLDAWIEQGANYDLHWSFKKPEKADPPPLENPEIARRVSNEIDSFVFARLERENLTPQPLADLRTRLRRASLSLTGMLPKPEDVEAALAKPDPVKAYGGICRPTAGLDPLRRAPDPALAQRRPLCRYRRLPKRFAAQQLAVEGLGHQILPRKQTLRRIHHRTTGWRPPPQCHQ